MRRVHYAWGIAGLTFLILLAAAGVRAAVTVLILPLEAEFGWTRATISLAVSTNLLLFGLMGPFAAALMQRVGVRRTVLASLSLLASGVLLTTRMTAAWQLVALWGVTIGLGAGMMALVLGATITNRWFVARRGLVLGVLTAATATGQLIFLPLLAAIIERAGWRWAALLVAGVLVAMLPVVALFMRERPADVGLRPYGAPDDSPSDVAAVGRAPTGASSAFTAPLLALARATRSRDFWLLAGTFFICGASTNGLIGTHLIPAAHDHGIPEVAAAGLLAMMGVFDFIGTTASGWLTDRWSSRQLLFWYYALRGLSLIFLPTALATGTATGPALSFFAVFYGLDWIATVPPTVRLANEAFGVENGPMMFGWVVAAHQVGAAVAAYSAGLTRTISGDYRPAFMVSGALCIVAAFLALQIGVRRGVQRDKRTLEPARAA
jgi:MFS family permease